MGAWLRTCACEHVDVCSTCVDVTLTGQMVVCWYVCVYELVFRLEKQLDGWMKKQEGEAVKGADNEDEKHRLCFDLVMKDERVAVESG